MLTNNYPKNTNTKKVDIDIDINLEERCKKQKIFKYSDCLEAAKNNDFEEFKKMHSSGYSIEDEECIIQSCIFGNLELLKYILQFPNELPYEYPDLDQICLKHKNIDCWYYLVRNDEYFRSFNSVKDNITILIEYKRTDFLSEMLSVIEELEYDTFKWSNEKGYLDWFISVGDNFIIKDPYNNLLEDAIKDNNLKLIEYLLKRGCEWGEYCLEIACRNNNLEILLFCLNHGCNWSGKELLVTIENNSFECFSYILLNKFNSFEVPVRYCAHYNKSNSFNCSVWYSTQLNSFNSFENAVWNCAHYNNFEFFKFCFENCNDPHTFWKLNFDVDIFIDRIQIEDNSIWRKLIDLNIDLTKYPKLEFKVQLRKNELIKIKDTIYSILIDKLPSDVIKYCIHTYI